MKLVKTNREHLEKQLKTLQEAQTSLKRVYMDKMGDIRRDIYNIKSQLGLGRS